MTNKNFFIKMVNKYHQNNKEKLRKETREMSQDLLEEENEKGQKKARQIEKSFWRRKEKSVSIIVIEPRIFLKKKNKKKVEYMRNYYLAHKKIILSTSLKIKDYQDITFWVILRQNSKTFQNIINNILGFLK